MGKFLSIVIPRHKETEKDVFPLLSSINGQVGIDFADIEAVISNDGEKETEPLDEGFFSLFGFGIRQITCKENRGCGPARQAGIDVARGEYVLCCDADDTLHNVGALGAVMQELETHLPDMLVTAWLEELVDGAGRRRYITHENDNTWMHGKLYRRRFLSDQGIRFPDFLRVQEDSYFNGLAAAFAEKRLYLPITSYVWKYNPKSTTRRDGGVYTYASAPDFIRSCALCYGEIDKRAPEQMERKVLQFTVYNYFCFHQPGWLAPCHAEFLEKAERAFVSYIDPFWHYWENADPKVIAEVYNQERQRSFVGCVERETVWEWLLRIGLGLK